MSTDERAENDEDAIIFKDGTWQKKFAREMNATEQAAQSELTEMRQKLGEATEETEAERDDMYNNTVSRFAAAQKKISDRAQAAASEATDAVSVVVASGSKWMGTTSHEILTKAREEDALAKQVAEEAEARAKKFDADDDTAITAMKGVQKSVSDMTLGMDHMVEDINRQSRNRESALKRERERALQELEDMNKKAKMLGGGSLIEEDDKDNRAMRVQKKLEAEEKKTQEINRENDENEGFLNSLLKAIVPLA